MIKTLIATHTMVQQITEQDLVRKRHGDRCSRESVADLNGHHQIGETRAIIRRRDDRRRGGSVALQGNSISLDGLQAIEDITNIESDLHSIPLKAGWKGFRSTPHILSVSTDQN
jgi:hypothetical protein